MSMITIQQLVDLNRDVDDFATFMHGSSTASVTPRYGSSFPTLRAALSAITNSLGAYPYKTLALLNAAGSPSEITGNPDANFIAMVWGDGTNNGFYAYDNSWLKADIDLGNTTNIPRTYHSLSEAASDTTVEVGELVETASYHGDIGSIMLARGGNTYLKISGQTNADDGCRYIHTDDGNTLVGLFPDGFVTVEQAGAIGSYEQYTGDKIASANAVAINLRYKLVFTEENYNCGTDSFIVNGWRAKWEGRGGSLVRLYWDAAPASGYAIRIIGDDGYESTDRMTQSVFSGISIVGGSKNDEYEADAIQLSGGTAATRLSCCSLDWFAIQGFEVTLRYNDYCWKVHVNNMRTIGGYIETPSEAWNAAVDFGECMVIRDSFIADSSNTPSNFRRGEWQFIGTSFDNVPVHSFGDAILTFNNSHLENPNNSLLTYKYLIANGKSKITVRNSWITTNNRAMIEPPLTSNVSYELTGGEGGIFLDNVTWNMNDVYDPRGNGYAHNYIIGGDGRSDAKSMNWLGFQPYWAYPISKWSNKLGNGDFELGDGTSWQVRVIDTSTTQLGNAQLTVVDSATTAPKSGTYCGQLTATYDSGGGVQGGELYQAVPCSPGDLIAGGLYLKNDWNPASNAGLFQVLTYFYDAAGNRISFVDQYGNSIPSYVHQKYTSQLTDWSYRHLGLIVPKGAAFCEICVQVLANTATANTITAWVDEFHVDVQKVM